MRWKDTSRVENTGADGGPIRNQSSVAVYLPDNGRGDCNLPIVPEPKWLKDPPADEEPSAEADKPDWFMKEE
jgi:hypothetical protein